MGVYERDGVSIHFDDVGQADGFPVLLIAPGGMRSASQLWDGTPWNPRAALADDHRIIAMDQRNAGRSEAPISGDDGWADYTADQLGLLDHLGIERCHVVGMCIGGPYIMGLLTAAPDRFAAAVMLQPVGIEHNRQALMDMFDQWSANLADRHPNVTDDEWASFRSNMWDGEFVLTATPEEAAAVATPSLIAMGDDLYHPQSTSRALAEVMPNATLVERWKTDDAVDEFDRTARGFLAIHTPR